MDRTADHQGHRGGRSVMFVGLPDEMSAEDVLRMIYERATRWERLGHRFRTPRWLRGEWWGRGQQDAYSEVATLIRQTGVLPEAQLQVIEFD